MFQTITIIILVTCSTVLCQFQSSHWENGTTDFLSEIENKRVKGVYIPFRYNSPLFNLSLERVSETYTTPKPVPVTSPVISTTISSTKSTTKKPDSPTYVNIPIVKTEDNPLIKCENLLKSYVNDHEAMRFEVRVYAIQLANITIENKDLRSKIEKIEKKNIQLFMENGLCEDRNTALSNHLIICKQRRY